MTYDEIRKLKREGCWISKRRFIKGMLQYDEIPKKEWKQHPHVTHRLSNFHNTIKENGFVITDYRNGDNFYIEMLKEHGNDKNTDHKK